VLKILLCYFVFQTLAVSPFLQLKLGKLKTPFEIVKRYIFLSVEIIFVKDIVYLLIIQFYTQFLYFISKHRRSVVQLDSYQRDYCLLGKGRRCKKPVTF